MIQNLTGSAGRWLKILLLRIITDILKFLENIVANLLISNE